jgi:hypothetical protein
MTLTLDPTPRCYARLVAAIEHALDGVTIERPLRLTAGHLYVFHQGPAPAVTGAILGRGQLGALNKHFAPRGLRLGFEQRPRSALIVYREPPNPCPT